jgi:hypothetical protein
MIKTDRTFWIRYLGEGTELSGHQLQTEFLSIKEDEPQIITIVFPERYSLEIEVYGGHRLRLCDETTSRNMELGWMDCHQMSDAFRFEELSDICAASSMLPRWQIRALLSHYVAPMPINIEALVSTFRSSLLESGLFNNSECIVFSDYMRRIVRERFQWIEDSHRGWVGIIEDAEKYPWMIPYTLRTRENQDFDFAFLNNFLSYCREMNEEN